MQRTRLLAKEVPGGIVCGGSLRNLVITARFDRVNQIREENGVLDEKDRNVVSDDI